MFTQKFAIFWSLVLTFVRRIAPEGDFAFVIIIRTKSRKAVIIRTERNPRYVDLLDAYDIQAIEGLPLIEPRDRSVAFLNRVPWTDSAAHSFVSEWVVTARPSRTSVRRLDGQVLDFLWGPPAFQNAER